jgi:hypothetical protein
MIQRDVNDRAMPASFYSIYKFAMPMVSCIEFRMYSTIKIRQCVRGSMNMKKRAWLLTDFGALFVKKKKNVYVHEIFRYINEFYTQITNKYNLCKIYFLGAHILPAGLGGVAAAPPPKALQPVGAPPPAIAPNPLGAAGAPLCFANVEKPDGCVANDPNPPVAGAAAACPNVDGAGDAGCPNAEGCPKAEDTAGEAAAAPNADG